MKKKDIIDLITAHYENDPRLFFHKTIEILKEFQEDGDKELVEYLSNRIRPHVKIAPKREPDRYNPEISFEDAEKLGWTLVPQDSEITNKEDMEFIEEQEKIKHKLGFSLNDMLKSQGSKNE